MQKHPSKERIAIFIDGSNFYKYMHDKRVNYPTGKKFKLKSFIENLVTTDRQCVVKKYYLGIFRNTDGTPKSAALVSGQQKFLAHLQNDGFIIERGRIMYDSGPAREKGTDVKIAIDMVIGAGEDQYDTAILLSSDTDLVPALRYVRSKGKKVEYIGFAHAPSFGMQKNADLSKLLSPTEILEWIE